VAQSGRPADRIQTLREGMRLGEAASLLAVELPGQQAADGAQVAAISLAAAVTKRSRARAVFVPARLVRALHRYRSVERGELVARLRADSGYRIGDGTVLISRAGPASVSFAGGGASAVGEAGCGDTPPADGRYQRW
jgi:hypothetical protein